MVNPIRQKEIQAKYDAKRSGPKRNLSKSDAILKRKYGITLQDYHVMLENQNNSCKICGSITADTSNINRRFAVDHCHDTGRVRGLLCIKCNTGIGMFNDNEDLLISAIAYLKEYK